jgi:flavin reductase (DIM6/NTAB) family NADH-FMN oxidoreductase RutF
MDAANTLETESMREAMAECANGVCVVTVGSGLERHGLTVSSMTSVSLSPPTLLFCINRQSSAWPMLERTRCFAVNVLAVHHSGVADQFAGRFGWRNADRFEGAEWRTLQTGAPILGDAVAAFDCEVEQIIERYSHFVVFGRVCASLASSNPGGPLLYWRRHYRELFHSSAARHDADSLLHAFDWQ